MQIIRGIKNRKLIIERKSRYFSISKYGKIIVTDEIEGGVPVRLLLVNGTRESATYTTPGMRNEAVFEYIRTIDAIIRHYPSLRRALIIGGAGYAFPKFYISHFKDVTIDVVENNPEMIEIAKKYFYLDELYEEYHLEETGRLETFIDDGMHYLKTSKRTYDLIINDAFVGNVADKGLASAEGVKAVFDRLEPGGLYLINAITARTGKGAMPGIMAQEVVSRIFGRAQMCAVRPGYPSDKSQNVIICAEKAQGEAYRPAAG